MSGLVRIEGDRAIESDDDLMRIRPAERGEVSSGIWTETEGTVRMLGMVQGTERENGRTDWGFPGSHRRRPVY